MVSGVANPADEWWTTSDVAAFLGVQVATVTNYRKRGQMPVPDATVADLWFAEVVRAVDAGKRSPGTLDTYRTIYRTKVGPGLGALRVREVTTPAVDRFLSAVKDASPSGAKTAKTVVSGIMRFAARHGAVTHNPVREVGRIDSPVKRPARSLTAAKRQAWLDTTPTRRPAGGTSRT